MARRGMPALAAAAVCFLVYFGDVAAGAAGATTYLGDIGEMLTLLAASTLFVIGVLLREAAGRNDSD